MGRYYNGDIKGKFWFAVQSSDDANFFGVEGYQVEQLHYYFNEDDIPKIKAGIQKCLDALKDYKQKLDAFFAEREGYNDDTLSKEVGIPKEEVKYFLSWYSRLLLGEKILKCVEENGACEFDAEL